METECNARLVAPWSGRTTASFLFVAYAVLLLPIYFLPVLVPDEIWFLDDAQKQAQSWDGQSIWQILTSQENHLGYGAIYWLGYGLVVKVCPFPLIAMRCIAYCCNLLIPFWLLRQYRSDKSPGAFYALVLWMTFPAAWWAGKVTGPELFSMVLLFGGLYWLSRAKRAIAILAAGALLGAAVGLKSNSLPAAFAMFFILPQIPRPWRALSIISMGAVLGLLICNPFLICNPIDFVANVPRRGKFGAGYCVNHIRMMLWNTQWEWDGVYRGGYFNWAIAPLTLPVYLIFLRKSDLPLRWFVGGVICTIAGFLLYLTSKNYQGWYWLPLATLFPLTVLHVRTVNAQTHRWALALLLVNLLANSPWIGFQYYSKFDQLAHAMERKEVIAEAQRVAASAVNKQSPNPATLVTILDTGFEFDPETARKAAPLSEYFSNLSGLYALEDVLSGKRKLKQDEIWLIIQDRRMSRYYEVVVPQRDEDRLGIDIQIQESGYLTTYLLQRKTLTASKDQKRR